LVEEIRFVDAARGLRKVAASAVLARGTGYAIGVCGAAGLTALVIAGERRAIRGGAVAAGAFAIADLGAQGAAAALVGSAGHQVVGVGALGAVLPVASARAHRVTAVASRAIAVRFAVDWGALAARPVDVARLALSVASRLAAEPVDTEARGALGALC